MKKLGANIVGTKNTTYDLDKLTQDSRLNANMALVIHKWEYNPNSTDPTKRSPRPANLQTAQIWFAKRNDNL